MEKKIEHPSKDIRGSESSKLANKTICLCLTGSVAVVNSVELARGLMRHGAEVYVVMTKEAKRLIHPNLLHWSTGNEVITKLTGKTEHIALAGERPNEMGKADLILIAPATANTISKIACGIDDTPVTTIATTAFGSKTPIVIVPAMHESMYNHPILKDNIDKLQKLGVEIILPRVEEGKAKISKTSDIIKFIVNKLNTQKDLKDLSFLVTSGPSREMIDRLRFISNPSSGRTGIDLAQNIINRGGNVTLILGKCSFEPPIGAKTINVLSAQDFVDAINNELSDSKNNYKILISAAALADFTPINKEEKKISSDKDLLTIELKSTPKLIESARNIKKDLFIVGYKAETNYTGEELVDIAYKRLQSAELNLIVANNVNQDDSQRGFESTTNEVFIIDTDKQVTHIPLTSKKEIAAKLIDVILEKL